MAPELCDRRFKSTSNILNEAASREDESREDLSARNRFRTYTFKDLRQERKYFAENVVQERKKSRNLIRRLIGSLERKNEECKADDEFFARYYRRNDYSDPNFDHSLGTQNSDFDDLVPEKPIVSSNRGNGSPDRCNDVRRFERGSVDLVDSRDLSTSEGILEDESFERRKDSKKRLDRKRSIKDFLGSMIKWRRSSAKETRHPFVSCDHLADKISAKKKDRKLLSRTSSLSAVDGCQKTLQSEKPKATIHPVYGGRRNEQLLEVLTRNKENWEVPAMESIVEELRMPTGIRRHSDMFFPTRGPRKE
ncbi:uncharacterized protein LOC116433230 [Nomia melanderi]|uniref:uncharacterized protein LOC116433230 n=1 Tax=Nomia melanderi TaxID=2448451 RepID=UPI003FCDE5A4